MWTAIAFVALAVVHLLPAAPIFAPDALVRLYGVAPTDSTLILILRHRAVLLALVGALCLWAAVSESTRPAALVAASLNLASFLAFYLLHASFAGPLRTVALVDAVALIPLAVAAWGTFARA
jgi:hypothetical protein